MPRLVSAVIPTFNRARDVCIAIRTALEQTYPAESIEVIVVDDGSTDDTAEVLRREFGDRIRYLPKANGGVSSARNHGLAAARGEYLALLDSDDEWLPDHVAAQVEYLERRPDFGMVLTDVALMDAQRQDFAVFRRRKCLPEDGRVLRWVLSNPVFVPASATFRRAVYEDVGGFDESLRTAEDLDFHLRVALRWSIGVIERPLTRAMRGHHGLSALAQTLGDDLAVVERLIERHGHAIGQRDIDSALVQARARYARGKLYGGDVAGALRCAASSVARVRRGSDALTAARLAYDLARGIAVRAHRAVRGLPQEHD